MAEEEREDVILKTKKDGTYIRRGGSWYYVNPCEEEILVTAERGRELDRELEKGREKTTAEK